MLYCARGQDESFIKTMKNDLASDRTCDHAFLANHLRRFYACATYRLIHSLRGEGAVAHRVSELQYPARAPTALA